MAIMLLRIPLPLSPCSPIERTWDAQHRPEAGGPPALMELGVPKGSKRKPSILPGEGESSCGEPCAHPHIGLLLFFIPGMQAGRGGFLPGDSVLLPVGERRDEGTGARLRVELELQACRAGEGGEAWRESMCKPGTFGTSGGQEDLKSEGGVLSS